MFSTLSEACVGSVSFQSVAHGEVLVIVDLHGEKKPGQRLSSPSRENFPTLINVFRNTAARRDFIRNIEKNEKDTCYY